MTAGGGANNPSSWILFLLPHLLLLQTMGGGINSPWSFFYLLPLLLGGQEMQGYLTTAILFLLYLGGRGVAPGLKTCLLFPVLLHLGGQAMTSNLNNLSLSDVNSILQEGKHPPAGLHSFLLNPRSHSLSLLYPILFLFSYLASTVSSSSLFCQLPSTPQPLSVEMTLRDKDSVKFKLFQTELRLLSDQNLSRLILTK